MEKLFRAAFKKHAMEDQLYVVAASKETFNSRGFLLLLFLIVKRHSQTNKNVFGSKVQLGICKVIVMIQNSKFKVYILSDSFKLHTESQKYVLIGINIKKISVQRENLII